MAEIIFDRKLKLIFNDGLHEYVVDGTTPYGGISSGSIKVEKMLCDNDIHYGELNSDRLEASVFNCNIPINNSRVQLVSVEGSTTKILFDGYVDSTVKDTRSGEIKIVAYDYAYTIRNDNVADWWEGFWSTHTTATLWELKQSLCGMYVPDVDGTTFVNDSVRFKKPCDLTSISFGAMLSAICELECCFPRVVSLNEIKFIQLDNTYTNISANYERNTSSLEEYVTAPISGIAVYDSNNHFCQEYIGDGEATPNRYNISGNLFLLGLSATTLDTMLENIYNEIATLRHTPCDVNLLVNDLSLDLGKAFKIGVNDSLHYVLSLTMSGSLLIDQNIKDVAQGEYIPNESKSYNKDIVTDRKFSSFQQTLDGITAEVYDSTTGASRIDILANQVSAKVSGTGGDDRYFAWSLTVDGFILSSHFKDVLVVDKDGLTVSGTVTADSGQIANFTINTDNLLYGSITGFYDASNYGIYLGKDGLRLGPNFSVNTTGTMNCLNAIVTGTINATQGTIGSETSDYQWTIGGNNIAAYIYSGNSSISALSLGVSSANVYLGTDGFSTSGDNERSNYTSIIRPDIIAAYGDATLSGQYNRMTVLRSNGLALYQTGLTKVGTISVLSSYKIAEIQNNNNNGFAYLSGTWKSSSAISVTSDRNLKHDIANLSDKYIELVDLLKPRVFRYDDGTSGRLHTGFIAQEVKESMDEIGLSSRDFAALCFDHLGTENEYWSLRYEEFIPLLVAKIKQLESKLEEKL